MPKKSIAFGVVLIIVIAGATALSIQASRQMLKPVVEDTPILPATTTPPVVDTVPTTTPKTAVVLDKESLQTLKTATMEITITGKAKGTWFFEGSFPIRIVDSKGKTLGRSFAQSTSDWMTTGYVSFTSTISLSSLTTATGTIIFANDNPSGLPEKNESFSLPVTFALSSVPIASSTILNR